MNNVYLPNSTIILFVGIKRRIETKEIHPITAKGINTHLEPYLLRCISIPFSSPNEPQTIAKNKYKALKMIAHFKLNNLFLQKSPKAKNPIANNDTSHVQNPLCKPIFVVAKNAIIAKTMITISVLLFI